MKYLADKIGTMPLTKVRLEGMPRCGVPARQRSEGGTNLQARLLVIRFHRLALRAAMRTAQRAVPTRDFRQLDNPWQNQFAFDGGRFTIPA
jgi:hypothetical protein